MKLIKKDIDAGSGAGFAKVVPEESEDMWHLYNLIRAGDRVTAPTFRKVDFDVGLGKKSEKIKVTLQLLVEGVDYDAAADNIRISGKNLTENEHIRLNAHHTTELEPHRALSLEKDAWDTVDLDRLHQACTPARSADLAAILVDEGLANLVLVGGSVTTTCAKIEANLPRKRGAAAQGFEKAMGKFYANCMAALDRHVDFGVVKCLVIAGPGFTKDGLREFVDKEAVRANNRKFIEHKSRIVTAQASSAYKHALGEVLAQPNVAQMIKDTKAQREVQALQEFYDMLGKDSARAFYGPGHVFAAAEQGAVQTLLLADSLFRTTVLSRREQYTQLVETVRASGGEALVFSAAHSSGEQLALLSGVAAILRFPMPDIEDEVLPDPTLTEDERAALEAEGGAAR
ncbi:unnamed protein product [Pedinophyceae sp. YPF-701]|nr:unnamed protein product [Pedinophyceae sp. YPF-701]